MNQAPSEPIFPEDLRATRLLLARVAEGSRLCADDPERCKLLERAVERGAFPILYRYLERRGESLGPWAAGQWRTHVARLALYRAELARVHRVLRPIGPVVVLKGEPLARVLYGDGRLRNTTDMDLLIDPSTIDQAVAALGDLGYRPLYGPRAKTWAYNQLALLHRDYGTLVELHWRIAFPHLPSPPIADLLADTRPVAVGDQQFETLAPELLFLQLAYHFHQHRGFLKGLLDIAGWIDRFEPSADLDAIARWGRNLGIGGLLQWPLHALDTVVGVRSQLYRPHPDLFVRAWAAHTAAKIERDFVDLRPRGPAQEWFEAQSFGAKIATTIAQSLSMTVADRAPAKLGAAISPIVFGPHRLGRAVVGGLERLGVVDRDALYEARLLR